MKDEVKVCLIGSGRAGMIHGHNFAGSVPGGKIIAVCDQIGRASCRERVSSPV